MADLPPQSLALPPVTAVTTNAGSATPTPPIAVQIVALPDALAQVARQLDLTATVAMAPLSDVLKLTTALGDVTVSLSNLASQQQQTVVQQLLAAFDGQKTLSLVINPGAPPSQAFLFLPATAGTMGTTMGTATGATIATPPLQSISLPAAIPPSPSIMLPIVSVGSDATAIVLPQNFVLPAGEMTSNTAPPPQVLPEVSLPVLPTATAVPSTAPPLTQPQSAIPVGTLPSVASQPTSSTLVTTSVAVLLQPGTEVAVHIDAVVTPGTNPPLLPNQVTATVIGNGANGQLILKAGDATLFVKQASDLPVGTNLLLTVSQTRDSVLLPLPPPTNFATLQQVIFTLTQLNPQAAQHMFEAQLPQPSQAFPASLLFMMTAIKQGDTRSWLGDSAVDALIEAGKFILLDKLVQESASPGQVVQDGTVGQWQSYPLPLMAQSQLQIMSLYVHLDPDQQARANAGKKTNGFTRFVIDVNFTKLGPMQLDGFVQAKKLDMVVRSEKPLPEGLAPDLRNTYHGAMEAVGFAGSLGFQTGRKNWLMFKTNRAASGVTT